MVELPYRVFISGRPEWLLPLNNLDLNGFLIFQEECATCRVFCFVYLIYPGRNSQCKFLSWKELHVLLIWIECLKKNFITCLWSCHVLFHLRCVICPDELLPQEFEKIDIEKEMKDLKECTWDYLASNGKKYDMRWDKETMRLAVCSFSIESQLMNRPISILFWKISDCLKRKSLCWKSPFEIHSTSLELKWKKNTKRKSKN